MLARHNPGSAGCVLNSHLFQAIICISKGGIDRIKQEVLIVTADDIIGVSGFCTVGSGTVDDIGVAAVIPLSTAFIAVGTRGDEGTFAPHGVVHQDFFVLVVISFREAYRRIPGFGAVSEGIDPRCVLRKHRCGLKKQ